MRILVATSFISMMLSLLSKSNGFITRAANSRCFLYPSTINGFSTLSQFAVSISDSEEETRHLLKNKREIQARINSIGPVGALVSIITDVDEETSNAVDKNLLPQRHVQGLISMNELKLYREYLKHQQRETAEEFGENAKGTTDTPMKNLYIGDIVTAYVYNVRDDGKVDVGLRPGGKERVVQTRELILEKLKSSEGNTLPVGDKSDPKLIHSYFPGVSKLQFKSAVGSLFKDGLITPSKHSLTLVPNPTRQKKTANLKQTSAVNSKVKCNEPSNEVVLKPTLIYNYLTNRGDGSHGFTDADFGESSDSSTSSLQARVLKKKVLYGVGIDSVYITGLSFKTKETSLVRDFFTEQGRPSGKAIVKIQVNGTLVKVASKSTQKEIHMQDDLNQKTVIELKSLLRSNGLKVSGAKSELIDRLKEYQPSDPGQAAPGAVNEVEEEVQLEDVISDICDLSDSNLDGRNIFIRPYFPARSSASSRNPQSSWIEKEFEQELLMGSRAEEGKVVRKEVGTEVTSKGLLVEKNRALPSSTFKSTKQVTNSGNNVSEKRSQDRALSSNDFRLARLSGSMKRGGDSKLHEKTKNIGTMRRHKNNVCVFFGNLPYNLPQLDLADEIESVVGEGAIVEMRASPYGDYCHVDFANEQHAAVAVREMNEFVINNRPLKVDYAKAKDKERFAK